jgi:hypothetical protein
MVTEAVAVKRHKQKMTMLLPDCASVWGWNMGQQSTMSKGSVPAIIPSSVSGWTAQTHTRLG